MTTTDTLTIELDKLRARLIARRVSKGNREDESRDLLAELETAHDGDNLAYALAYNGFATERGAEVMAMSLTRYRAAVDLGELGL